MLRHGHGGFEDVKDVEGNDIGGHPPTILCKMNFYISSNKMPSFGYYGFDIAIFFLMKTLPLSWVERVTFQYPTFFLNFL
jgi:hypothetical protein